MERKKMRSIAGSVIVLAGALVMGLASRDIPTQPFPTITSLGLIVIGLLVVFAGGRASAAGKSDTSSFEG
jgi:hypothetical protein